MKKEKTNRQIIFKVQPSLYEKFLKKCNKQHRCVSEVFRDFMVRFISKKEVE